VNLQGIVAPLIGAINPPIICTLQVSAGYTIGPDGTQTPAYTTVTGLSGQVQPLSYTDLMKLDGLNIQGTRRKVYLNGNFEGIDRQAVKGGDLLTMPTLPDFAGPTTWLVVQVLEWWQDWCALAVTLQNPAPG
jgi:hypothetical protein